MARKTNKTAHVLNLITNPSTENAHEDEIIEDNLDFQSDDVPTGTTDNVMIDSSLKTEPSKPSNPSAAPVVQILSNEHDPLSDLIKNVLSETSQENEIKNNTPKVKPSMLNSAAIIEEPKKVEDAKLFDFSLEFDEEGNEIEHIEAKVVSEPEVIPKPSNQSTPVPENAEVLDECDCNSNQLLEHLEIAKNMHFHDRKDLNSMIDLDFKYVNIYEIIVQDKLLDYMKKFDVCMCDRCIVDTLALAVTALPNKIVVVDKKEIFPLVNFFGVKNTAIISTALIKACMIVKNNPNHNK